MKLFDEEGNLIEELADVTKEEFMEFVEKSKNVFGGVKKHTYEASENDSSLWWLWPLILGIIIAPGWTILILVGLLVWFLISLIVKCVIRIIKWLFKLMCKISVLVLCCLWWIIKLPFCLIFKKRLPKFSI